MPKKGYTPEQIINKLREAEVLLSQGNTIGIVASPETPPLFSVHDVIVKTGNNETGLI